ncbi:MAG: hypothetical protein ABIY55_00160 [Kofleriaceae bacterium]
MATATATQLTSRASFDLSCPSGTLRYKRIDDRTQGVLGCGKRAIYVENCDGPRDRMQTSCTWVLNGAIEAEPTEPTAPAAPAASPELGAMPSNAATPLPAAPPQ